MGPVNAAVRFVCELVALYGVGAGTWSWTGSVLAAIALPVATAVLWGVFRVPDDPGPPPVVVPGWVRLSIEAAVFGGGALGLWASHGAPAGITFALVVGLHYATTPVRLRYLWSCRQWGSAKPPTASTH